MLAHIEEEEEIGLQKALQNKNWDTAFPMRNDAETHQSKALGL